MFVILLFLLYCILLTTVCCIGENLFAFFVGCIVLGYVYRIKMYHTLKQLCLILMLFAANPLYHNIIGDFSFQNYTRYGYFLTAFFIITWFVLTIRIFFKIKELWRLYPHTAKWITGKSSWKECKLSNLLDLIDFDKAQFAQLESNRLQSKYPYGFKKYRESHSIEECIMEENEIRLLEDAVVKYLKLQALYPYAVEKYNEQYKNDPNIEKRISAISEDKFIKLEELHRESCEHNQWEKEQEYFTKDSRKECLSDWGCYSYDLNFVKKTEDGGAIKGKYLLWQHFICSFCDNPNLDYTHFSSKKQNYEALDGIRKCQKHFGDSIYDSILNFIKKIRDKYSDTIVVFGDSNLLPIDVETFNNYHFKYLKNCLAQQTIPYFETFSSIGKYTTINQHIIVVESISTNDHMIQECYHLSKIDGGHPCITFVSLVKGLSTDEMKKLISNKKKELLKIEREKKKKEEEKNLEDNILETLNKVVSQWDTIAGLPYKYLLKYYPTTCDFVTIQQGSLL